MKLNKYIPQWKRAISDTCISHGFNCEDVKTGVDAWTIAHKSGVVAEAYSISRDVLDAHIQTALEKIFPNAVFKDKKIY